MFYDQVRKKATERGISIAEIARRANIDPTLIGKWKKSWPSVDKAKRVADVLDCTVDELIAEPAGSEQYFRSVKDDGIAAC